MQQLFRRLAMPAWLMLGMGLALSATSATDPRSNVGPYNVTFLEGGVGLTRPLAADMPLLAAGAPWSMTGWLNVTRAREETIVLAAIGDGAARTCRCLLLRNGNLALGAGPRAQFSSSTAIRPNEWTAIAATYDGTVARLYANGNEVASQAIETIAATPALNMAPHAKDPLARDHFGGSLAQFQIHDKALTADAVRALASAKPRIDLTVFHAVGSGWPWQQRAWRGLQEPQDPWTLPRSQAAPDKPVAIAPVSSVALEKDETADVWTVGSWRLREAPRLNDDGARISQPGYRDDDWYAATVPGTVLTTLIDRGVFPDPDHGLNNMVIPESLARQSYWYRTQFSPPPETAGKQLTLTFKGINYSANVWLNGEKLGDVKGAFIRGIFNVTGKLKPGQPNVLAVRISPPPHPGIAHEESVSGRPRREWRQSGDRRPHVCRQRGLGLDSRHPRPEHRPLARR